MLLSKSVSPGLIENVVSNHLYEEYVVCSCLRGLCDNYPLLFYRGCLWGHVLRDNNIIFFWVRGNLWVLGHVVSPLHPALDKCRKQHRLLILVGLLYRKGKVLNSTTIQFRRLQIFKLGWLSHFFSFCHIDSITLILSKRDALRILSLSTIIYSGQAIE